MEKERIETLLKQISRIVEREKIQQEERRKRGENFNIFSVLGLSTSEVRLHSAFLTELLNPNGNHGLGDMFLKCFFDTIVKRVEPNFEFETESAIANSEFYIGTISEDYTEGGRIDILIQDKNNHAIVIENKIYAGDQEKQLIRYQNYAKKTAQKYVMLYLALDTKQASEYSTDNQVDYKCLSYKDDILPWLQQCIGIAALNPQVREIIAQYKFNLETILNIMSKDNKKELIELLKKNMSTTISIIELEDEIKKEIRRNYVDTVLKRIAEKYGFSINPEYAGFIECKKDSTLVFNSKDNHSGLFVLRMHQTSDVFYGIMLCDEKLKGVKVNAEWRDSDIMFPYNGNWMYRYWNKNYEAINIQKEIEMNEAENIEGTIAKEIDDALKMVKEKNLLDQLDKLCKDQQ